MCGVVWLLVVAARVWWLSEAAWGGWVLSANGMVALEVTAGGAVRMEMPVWEDMREAGGDTAEMADATESPMYRGMDSRE